MAFSVQKPDYSPYFRSVGIENPSREALIPRTVPGEVWTAEHLKGEIFKPLHPLRFNYKVRRVPVCGHYPFCSGCQWLHVRPEFQTEFKVRLFEEFLGFKPDKVLLSPSEYGYRVSTLLYWKDGKLGFKKAWFYDERQPIVDIVHCHLLHPKLNEAIRFLKGFDFPESLYAVGLLVNPQSGELFLKLLFLKRKFPEEDLIKDLIDRLKPAFAGIGIYAGEYLHWERKYLYGLWESVAKVGGFKLLLSPDAFVQPNFLLWEKFAQSVRPLERHGFAVELHAGVGFFTFHLARHVDLLESSEINPFATLLRKKATDLNGFKNVKNLTSDALKHLKKVPEADLLVVDPPRGGLGIYLSEEILKKRPKEVIYISCNLKSLGRDLEILKRGYRVEKSLLVDQFSNTYHVESVIWLRR